MKFHINFLTLTCIQLLNIIFAIQHDFSVTSGETNALLCSRYKRVFSVGTHAITTYNPNTLEVTNQVTIIFGQGYFEFISDLRSLSRVNNSIQSSETFQSEILTKSEGMATAAKAHKQKTGVAFTNSTNVQQFLQFQAICLYWPISSSLLLGVLFSGNWDKF